MNAADVLLPDRNISELTKHAFPELDGVSNEWINSLRIEKVLEVEASPEQESAAC